MADDLKIPVSVPGADDAERKLRGVAEAEKQVGQGAEQAGRQAADAGRAAEQGAASFAVLNQAMGVLISTVQRAFRMVLDNLRELESARAAAFRQYVGQVAAPSTVALAQLRGAGEAETAMWVAEQAQQFGLTGEGVRGAAFAIESGIRPEEVGGAEGFARIQRAAFQTMRVTGAGGETAARMALAAREAGLGGTPEEIERFYGQATAFAGGSMISLAEFGPILGRLLPMAVSAGMDPQTFMSLAGAMSYRISDPSRLATSLEQLIRAAGRPSEPLAAFAAAGGRRPDQLSAMEILAFQSGQVGQAMAAGGPQAATAAAATLGLSAEQATLFGVAFDPAVQARMAGLRETAGGAGWEVIGGRFGQVMATPEAQAMAGAAGEQLQALRGAAKEAPYRVAEARAGQFAEYLRQHPRPGFGGRVWDWGYTRGQQQRDILVNQTIDALREAIAAGGPRAERARELLADLEAFDMFHVMIGAGAGDELRAAWEFLGAGGRRGAAVNVNVGTTQYITQDRRDPAGRREAPAPSP